MTDIKDRELEQRLRERDTQLSLARERYRLLLERSRDIMLFLRASDGRIVDANAAAIQAYGYTSDELLQLSIRDIRAEESLPELPQQLEDAGRGSVTFETMHRRKDGSQFPVEVSASSAESRGERLLLSVIRDITDRHRTDEALRQSERLLRQAMGAADAGTWTAIPETGVFVASERALEVHGLPPGTVMDNDRALACVHAEDRPRVEAALQHTLATGDPFRLEHRILRPDGSIRWVASFA